LLHAPQALNELPKGFPPVVVPEDNHFTEARWELGKKLFYDPALSVSNTISCASCHKPELAFSDNQIFSKGVEDRLGTRNAPSLANVAYHPYFTREGGVPTLEMQVFVPVQEHNEFDFNMVLLAERLAEDPEYVQMSKEAYDKEPDAFVITRALACFERSLISGYSSYDHYKHYGETDALSEIELKGMDLFFSERSNCYKCHFGFDFSDYSFSNNGLYEVYPDEGRKRLTGLDKDLAMFKVPGLRNITVTAPYMHDGSISTLEAVIDHYDSGGFEHPNKSDRIKPLNLTTAEKEALLAFLRTLTDHSFINNSNYRM